MLFSTSRFWRPDVVLAVLLMCAGASVASSRSAQAGEADAKAAAAVDTPQAVKNGELVFHGNYCGIGNRAGADPIDALDVACMHHDACTPSGKVQSCACNARLAEEATAVALDPSQPAELKSLATLTAAAATAGLGLCVTTAQAAPAPRRSAVPSQPVDLSPPAVAPASQTQEPVAPAPPLADERAPTAP